MSEGPYRKHGSIALAGGDVQVDMSVLEADIANAAYAAGFRAGAEAMRERAGRVAEYRMLSSEMRAAIRALPLVAPS